MDLVDKSPKDLAHLIRSLANRSVMLRVCGFRHIGEMLVAMLAASAHTDSEHAPSAAAQLATQNLAALSPEQATALGCVLAARVRSSQAPTAALHEVVALHSVLRTMNMRHAWFVPMLEVLLIPREAAVRPTRIVKRLSASVTPQVTARDTPSENFDSVVRPTEQRSQHRRVSKEPIVLFCRCQYRLLQCQRHPCRVRAPLPPERQSMCR
jgi:hypothetical protein